MTPGKKQLQYSERIYYYEQIFRTRTSKRRYEIKEEEEIRTMKLNDDGYMDLGSFQMFFLYSPKEWWIGIKNWRRPEEVKQEWRQRTGKKQLYLLQLIPCLGIAFKITRWTPIKKETKKKK